MANANAAVPELSNVPLVRDNPRKIFTTAERCAGGFSSQDGLCPLMRGVTPLPVYIVLSV